MKPQSYLLCNLKEICFFFTLKKIIDEKLIFFQTTQLKPISRIDHHYILRVHFPSHQQSTINFFLNAISQKLHTV